MQIAVWGLSETQVKSRLVRWLEAKGYRVNRESIVCGPWCDHTLLWGKRDSGLILHDIILDFHAHNDVDDIWCECKGDVGVSQLLEGFIRLQAALHYNKGRGMLVTTRAAKSRFLLRYKDFFERLLQQTPNIEVVAAEDLR